MSKAAGLGKAIHALAALDVYPPVGCGFVVEVIFLYYFLWDVTELELGKFRSF